jgi:hypothetical protein
MVEALGPPDDVPRPNQGEVNRRRKTTCRLCRLCAIVVATLIVVGCKARPTASDPPSQRHDVVLDDEYARLRKGIAKWNAEFEPHAWWMNSEHLFMYEEELMADVIAFNRRPGALEFLFEKVIDPRTGDQELLEIAEILVYFGGHPEPGDERIRSDRSEAVVRALDAGRAHAAEAKYPGAPVGKKIRDAAMKGQGRSNVYLRF